MGGGGWFCWFAKLKPPEREREIGVVGERKTAVCVGEW